MFQLRLFFGAALWLLIAQCLTAQNLNFQLRSSINFPGQTLANVCGWTAPDGREYALVGASKGMVIVDITNPDAPVQIVQIPGPDNLWKEIKTYSHYAYITSEGGGGVQIVDLSGLPGSNLPYHNYTGTSGVQLTNIHALHIDVTRGFLYTYGGNYEHAMVHDLNADPYNPVYAGQFSELGYIHDGYADNDTLYACHIYTGLLSVVDMTDKQNPVILGTVETPGRVTHNSWLLGNHDYILTTDEATPSFVTSYDISDPSDIKELDRFSVDNGNGSIGHNVQVINDYTVTSWYTAGVVVTDCHRPDNLVKVAQYDTWNGSGPNVDGCWGAFPYFPSGTVIASNISPGDLFILTPDYKRACYIEGIVRNGCSGLPLSGAQLKIIGGEASATDVSKNNGVIKTGQVTPGTFMVQISKPGFIPQEFVATLTPGEVASFDVTLQAVAAFNLSGTVTDAVSGQPVPNVPLILSNEQYSFEISADAGGTFFSECIPTGLYSLRAGQWGYISAEQQVNVTAAQNLHIQLIKGYYDDFSLDYGWNTDATSPAGLWERGVPANSSYNNVLAHPLADAVSDAGNECFVTGNTEGAAGVNDVDGGSVTLTTPPMALAGYDDAMLSFQYWFVNTGGNGTPLNDQLEVRVSNGQQDVQVLLATTSGQEWNNADSIHLGNLIELNNQVTVSFIATDFDPGHIVDAAIDVFKVIPVQQVNSVQYPETNTIFHISPNPSRSDFRVEYDWNGTKTPVLEVYNAFGQVMLSTSLPAMSGTVRVGEKWPAGVYAIRLHDGENTGITRRIVKN